MAEPALPVAPPESPDSKLGKFVAELRSLREKLPSIEPALIDAKLTELQDKLTGAKETLLEASAAARRQLEEEIDLLPGTLASLPDALKEQLNYKTVLENIEAVRTEIASRIVSILDEAEKGGGIGSKIAGGINVAMASIAAKFGWAQDKASQWGSNIWNGLMNAYHAGLAKLKDHEIDVFGLFKVKTKDIFGGLIDFDRHARFPVERSLAEQIKKYNGDKPETDVSRFTLAQDWDNSLVAEQALQAAFAALPAAGKPSYPDFIAAKFTQAAPKLGGGEITLSRIVNILNLPTPVLGTPESAPTTEPTLPDIADFTSLQAGVPLGGTFGMLKLVSPNSMFVSGKKWKILEKNGAAPKEFPQGINMQDGVLDSQRLMLRAVDGIDGTTKKEIPVTRQKCIEMIKHMALQTTAFDIGNGYSIELSS